MTIIYERSPDYIPFTHTKQEFFETFNALYEKDSKDYYYADRNGLKTVGKVCRVLEKLKGLVGLKDHTSIPNVESALIKFLYYGCEQNFQKEHPKVFTDWIKGLQTKMESPPFSTHLTTVLSLLQNPEENVLGQIQGHLEKLHEEHKIDSIGGKTKAKTTSFPEFGKTPVSIAKKALEQKKYDKALRNLELVYARLPGDNIVQTLYLQLAEKKPSPLTLERIKEIRDKTIEAKNYELAYKCDELVPESEKIKDPAILKAFAQQAAKQGKFKVDLQYLTGDEKKQAYVHLYEKAKADGNLEQAIRYYELAVESGHAKDAEMLGHLYLQTAEEMNHTKAIHFYEKSIAAFTEAKILPKQLINGTWLNRYLQLLNQQGRGSDGLRMLEGLAQRLDQARKEPNGYLEDQERLNHLNKVKPYIFAAIRLYEFAMHFDTKNAEYPFRIGNLKDHLRLDDSSIDTYSLFDKALELDPTNEHYRYCALEAFSKKGLANTDDIPLQLQENATTRWQYEHWYENDRFKRA